MGCSLLDVCFSLSSRRAESYGTVQARLDHRGHHVRYTDHVQCRDLAGTSWSHFNEHHRAVREVATRTRKQSYYLVLL